MVDSIDRTVYIVPTIRVRVPRIRTDRPKRDEWMEIDTTYAYLDGVEDHVRIWYNDPGLSTYFLGAQSKLVPNCLYESNFISNNNNLVI